MVYSRTNERFSLSQVVFFLNVITTTENLSLGGMSIITNKNIPDHQKISVGLELSDNSCIQLFAEPIWSKTLPNSKHVYGIEFLELSDDTKHELQHFLHL